MENETGISFPFDEKELAGRIMEAVLEAVPGDSPGNGCAFFPEYRVS